MYRAACVLICFLSSVARSDPNPSITLQGSAANLVVQGTTPGNVTDLVYGGCSMQDQYEQTTTGSVCVAFAVGHMLSAIANLPGQHVSVLNDTAEMPVDRRRGPDEYLDRFNENLRQGREGIVRATRVLPSTLHPADGIAIRTNVQSDDTTLYLHTNGTHAMAAFEPEPLPHRRDDMFSNETYHFSGVAGLKIQAQWPENSTCNAHHADMVAFAFGFAYGGAGNPLFMQSDSWKFAVCERAGSNVVFAGKLISELNLAGWNYENGTLQTCE